MRRSLLRPAILIAATLIAVPARAQQPDLPQLNRRTPIVLAVKNVGPAVVNIRTQDAVRRAGGRNLFQQFGRFEHDPQTGRRFADRSLGSGVIVHEDGYLITNEHVIAGADRIKVRLRGGRLSTARVLNANRDNDVAILKLDEEGPYPAATFGDSNRLLVGETTIALGNPFGLSNSVTSGILSATGRSVRFQGREVFSDFLQTSAIINPGNSGGPLLDINGRLIGINVAIDNRGPGIGYAIPIHRVIEVMTTLLDPEIILQAWVGFESQLKNEQLLVHRVSEQGPGMKAGIKDGDRILSVKGRDVATPFEFNIALLSARPGDPVPFRVARKGRVLTCQVPFQALPLDALAAPEDRTHVLGMTIANLTPAASAQIKIPSHLIGPLVLDVQAKSKAAAIHIQRGDVIIQVGNVATPTVARLTEVLRYYRRRGTVRIKVYRENEGEMQGTIAF